MQGALGDQLFGKGVVIGREALIFRDAFVHGVSLFQFFFQGVPESQNAAVAQNQDDSFFGSALASDDKRDPPDCQQPSPWGSCLRHEIDIQVGGAFDGGGGAGAYQRHFIGFFQCLGKFLLKEGAAGGGGGGFKNGVEPFARVAGFHVLQGKGDRSGVVGEIVDDGGTPVVAFVFLPPF